MADAATALDPRIFGLGVGPLLALGPLIPLGVAAMALVLWVFTGSRRGVSLPIATSLVAIHSPGLRDPARIGGSRSAFFGEPA
jgi:hypothetical protein